MPAREHPLIDYSDLMLRDWDLIVRPFLELEPLTAFRSGVDRR